MVWSVCSRCCCAVVCLRVGCGFVSLRVTRFGVVAVRIVVVLVVVFVWDGPRWFARLVAVAIVEMWAGPRRDVVRNVVGRAVHVLIVANMWAGPRRLV